MLTVELCELSGSLYRFLYTLFPPFLHLRCSGWDLRVLGPYIFWIGWWKAGCYVVDVSLQENSFLDPLAFETPFYYLPFKTSFTLHFFPSLMFLPRPLLNSLYSFFTFLSINKEGWCRSEQVMCIHSPYTWEAETGFLEPRSFWAVC